MGMDFKTLDLGKKCINEELEELKHQLEVHGVLEGTNDGNILELIITPLENLAVIVGFGRGFWAGSLDEYTLVYNKAKDTFHWIYFHFEKEELVIKNMTYDDAIFKFLQDFDRDHHQFDGISLYFEEEYPNLPIGNLDDIGFSVLNEDTFKYDVWGNFAGRFRNTRDLLAEEVKKYKKKQADEFKSNFYLKNKDKHKELIFENGKLYIIFDYQEKVKLSI